MDVRAGGEEDIAAWQLSEALGLRTPPVRMVEYDGIRGSIQPWVPDSRNLFAAPEVRPKAIGSGAAKLDDAGLRDLAQQSILDFVIANSDTHALNWLLDDSARLWAIDRSLGFARAVASSTNPITFWRNAPAGRAGNNGLFGSALYADTEFLFKATRPDDYARILDRLDAIDDVRFAELVDEVIDKVRVPFGDRAARVEALLVRKRAARAGYEAMLREQADFVGLTLPPEWRAWLDAGGTFPRQAAVSPVPFEGLAVEVAEASGTELLPAAMRTTRQAESRVGNNRAVWQLGFKRARTRAEATERLTALLSGSTDNVLDGFSLDQLNVILARTERLDELGVDLTRLDKLTDFERRPGGAARRLHRPHHRGPGQPEARQPVEVLGARQHGDRLR